MKEFLSGSRLMKHLDWFNEELGRARAALADGDNEVEYRATAHITLDDGEKYRPFAIAFWDEEIFISAAEKFCDWLDMFFVEPDEIEEVTLKIVQMNDERDECCFSIKPFAPECYDNPQDYRWEIGLEG